MRCGILFCRDETLSVKDTLGTLGIYVLTGLSVVGVAIYLGFYQTQIHPSRSLIELTFATSVVFGMLVRAYWKFRRSAKLWLILFVALLAHVSILGFPLNLYSHSWPLLAKTVMFSGEVMLLMILMYWICGFIPDARAS